MGVISSLPRQRATWCKIWRYLKRESSEETANRVESVIRGKIAFLSEHPHVGHWRRELTSANVRFFLVYSYFIVYRPDTKPLQVVCILHCRRDLANILKKRL
jgi:plasmid stabilization system protein ParE